MKTILFVCTGNTCRSSMAEALFKDMLAEVEQDEIEVISAGVSAYEGNLAHENAILALDEKGIESIKDHQAQKLNQELVEQSDLILTMTRRHKLLIFDEYPEAEAKTFSLKEYAFFDKEKRKKIEELQEIIKNKKEEFMLEHQKDFKELEAKKQRLEEELVAVKKEIVKLENKLSEKISLEKKQLKELRLESNDVDISDPFGQPIKEYKRCAKEIEDSLKKVLKKLD